MEIVKSPDWHDFKPTFASEKLAELHPLPGLVLEHRALSKLKGTYVDALPLLVDGADGRIHCSIDGEGKVWIGGRCDMIAQGGAVRAFG